MNRGRSLSPNGGCADSGHRYSVRMLECSSLPIAQCVPPGPLAVGDWVVVIVDRGDDQYPAGVIVRSSDDNTIAVKRVDDETDEDWRVTAQTPGTTTLQLFDPSGTLADTIELHVTP